jgi:hypothetical protein
VTGSREGDGPKDILRRLEEHQDVSLSYMDEGIALMEMANRAAELFAEQPASEKRRLLEFVLSNSFWANGELPPVFANSLLCLQIWRRWGHKKRLLDCLPAAIIKKSSPGRT